MNRAEKRDSTTEGQARHSRKQRRIRDFTAEAQRSQSSEGILFKNSLLLVLGVSAVSPPENLLKPRKISDSNTGFFPDGAGKKRFACWRTAAIETRNISRKGAKLAKVTGQGPSSRAEARDLGEISPSGRNDNNSELGVFAPWREEFPNPRIFDSQNIKAARYDKHVGVSFWIAMQYRDHRGRNI